MKLAESVRQLLNYPIAIGDPDRPGDWVYAGALELDDLPRFDLGKLLFLDGGGFRLLLFRWLVLVDPQHEEVYYQPLIWLGWETAGPEPEHLLFQFVVPFHTGRLRVIVPTCREGIKKLGLINVHWEDWRDDEFKDLPSEETEEM